MRCEDCGNEFSFIKNNTLCSTCLLNEKKKEKTNKNKSTEGVKNGIKKILGIKDDQPAGPETKDPEFK